MALREPNKKVAEKSQKEQVAELEEDIERLRIAFEQYFLGIDKRPPLERKEQVHRALRQMQTKRLQQTVTRFQFQGLVGRFNILDSYWTRTLRRIEEGTYQRDTFRAKLKKADAPVGQTLPPVDAAASGATLPPAANAAALVSEERLQRVYRDFIEARRFCGEPVDGLAYERLRAKLLAEAPKIADKARVGKVDFQVVIRDGRAIVKAVPVRDEG
jgi:hypothetical protein